MRPPDRLRLEFIGPMGGVRLLLATDGSELRAILPHERLYDRAPATPRAVARVTGLRFRPADLVALMRGKLPCAGAGGSPAPAGTLEEDGTKPCRLDDADVSLRVNEASWAQSISIVLGTSHQSIRLDLVDGPAEANLADDLFAPAVPEGYSRGNLLGDGQPLFIVDDPAHAEGTGP
ncbi:MAG TPA: hypothetical protein VFB49_04795 [Patescibacteria group bacterium]|nr:hypothetical protein [Patescibacteria group bacterium]